MKRSADSMEALIQMKRKATVLMALGAAMLISGTTLPGAIAAPLEVGKPFPALVLPDLKDGKPTSLESFRGKPLVLHVFASW
jgi:hypothetical protein